jgi:hypothetical protein
MNHKQTALQVTGTVSPPVAGTALPSRGTITTAAGTVPPALTSMYVYEYVYVYKFMYMYVYVYVFMYL